MRLASYWIPEMELAYAAFRQEGADVDAIGAQLKASLDRASAHAIRDGYSAEQVKHALYATVAWIDELAMSFDWPGSAAWRLSPLQRHYFATTRAGVGFFDRLAALPEDEVQVREVYALMLVAGFQGDFAHRPAAELQAFRTELLDRVAQESSMAPLGTGHALFPNIYAQTRRGPPRRTGPSTAAVLTIVIPMAILIVLYLYLNSQLVNEVTALITPLTERL